MSIKLVPTGYLTKNGVTNDSGENLGRIEELMIDLETGRVNYAVLVFGGFPNRTKYFAVPWELLDFSNHDKKYIFHIPRSVLINAAGYDTLKQVFESVDTYWLGDTYEYYSHKPEWEKKREEERQEELKELEERKAEVRYQAPKEEITT